MPLAADRKYASQLSFLWLALSVGLILIENRDMLRKGWETELRTGMLVLLGSLLLVGYLILLFNCLAKVHFVPEGIAVTLFGYTIRRVPAENIRFITALRPGRKAGSVCQIVISARSLEELTALAVKKTPKLFRASKEFWPGEWVEKYLLRRARWGLPVEKTSLWIPWSPERLKLLLDMYPQAQWLDCTQDKKFDNQLKP